MKTTKQLKKISLRRDAPLCVSHEVLTSQNYKHVEGINLTCISQKKTHQTPGDAQWCVFYGPKIAAPQRRRERQIHIAPSVPLPLGEQSNKPMKINPKWNATLYI
jgi:hypothetical protein